MKNKILAILLLLSGGLCAEDKVPSGEWQYPSGPGWVWVQKPPIFNDYEVQTTLSIPAGHEYISLIIENEQGQRIRNLLSMADIRLYGGDPKSGKEQIVKVPWNGLDDNGKQVPFGKYRMRGVSTPAIKALFDYSWYNPGNPPYDGYDLSGWGADHSGPTAIACAPPLAKYPVSTVVTWATSEAIHQVIGLDEKANKILGYVRTLGDFMGPTAVAMDETAAYLGDENLLMKLNLQRDEKKDSSFRRVWGEELLPSKVANNGVAVSENKGIIVFGKELRPDNKTIAKPFRYAFFDKIGFFSKKELLSALKDVPPGEFAGVAPKMGNEFYLSTDQGVYLVKSDMTIQKLDFPGLVKPGPITTDSSGRIYILDAGPDFQVKVFSLERKLERTIGKKGGQRSQPLSYALVSLANGSSSMFYDANALHSPVAGIAVDSTDRLWVTEAAHPRRVSVWDKEGKLTIEKFGGPNYGGSGLSLHESDPTLAFANGVIWKIDPTQISSYRPLAYSYVEPATSTEGAQSLKYAGTGFGHDNYFSVIQGSNKIDYISSSTMGYQVLFVSKNGVFTPVAALASSQNMMEKPSLIGIKPGLPVFWSDGNSNTLIESNEVTVLADPMPANSEGPFCGWHYNHNTNLVFYGYGNRIKPASIGEDGIPHYDSTSIEKFGEKGNVMVAVGKNYFGQLPPEIYEVRPLTKLWYDKEGKVIGQMTASGFGVHGSAFSADLPRGQAHGEQFVTGVVPLSETFGSVMATAGYRGQQYLYTDDGILFYELLRSHRDLHQKGLPETITKGYDISDLSGFRRQEAFNSWLGKQSDGVVRLLIGGGTEGLVARVENLDKATRIAPVTVEFSEKDKIPAAQLALRQKSRTSDRPLIIKEWVGNAPLSDGKTEKWQKVEGREIFQGDELVATIKLSYDSEFLYLLAEVKDSSPALNADSDYKSAFRQGDAIELQFGSENQGLEPGGKDLRLLFYPGKEKSKAVLFRPVDPSALPEEKVVISSPVRTVSFDSVSELGDVESVFKKSDKGYTFEARIPFKSIGLRPRLVKKIFGDVGILFSDPQGNRTVSRIMLFNKNPFDSGDAPSEAMILPVYWKEITFEPVKKNKIND